MEKKVSEVEDFDNIQIPAKFIEHFYSKTNLTHNFSSLLNITLHVSDGHSIHHQEFKTRDLMPASVQSANLYDIYLMLYVQS